MIKKIPLMQLDILVFCNLRKCQRNLSAECVRPCACPCVHLSAAYLASYGTRQSNIFPPHWWLYAQELFVVATIHNFWKTVSYWLLCFIPAIETQPNLHSLLPTHMPSDTPGRELHYTECTPLVLILVWCSCFCYSLNVHRCGGPTTLLDF